MPQEKTYFKVYPAQWNKIKEAAKAYNIKIEASQGKAEQYGVTLQWEWNYRVSSTAEPWLSIKILESKIGPAETALQWIDSIIQPCLT